MELTTITGLSPEELSDIIIQSPTGFSTENNGIQYLGREVHLKGGKTTIQQSDQHTSGDKALRDRLVALAPQLDTLVSDSKNETLKQVAQQLLSEYGSLALQKAPTSELKQIVALEYLLSNPTASLCSTLDTLDTFTEVERYKILIEYMRQQPDDDRLCDSYDLLNLTPIYRFKFTKVWSQNTVVANPQASSHSVNKGILPIDCSNFLNDNIELFKKIIEEEASELLETLEPVLDQLHMRFSTRTINNADTHRLPLRFRR